MKMAIQGIGVAGGFGCGMDELTGLLTSGGRRAQQATVKTAQGPCGMPAFLVDTTRLDDFVNKRVLRRVDHYSRMALLGAHLALQDAGRLEEDRSRMGIIIASGYGATRTTFAFLDSFINDGDNLSSPTFFSNSVQNAAVANVSMMLGITGPGLTVNQFEMSVPSALFAARDWLEEGRIDSVLFGAIDEYCDVQGYCWHRFFGEKAMEEHEIDPFAFDHQTAIPAEGTAFFLLTREASGGTPYGHIEDIQMGRCRDGLPAMSDDALIIAGADGHRVCGGYYKENIPEKGPVACYTPAYGSLPIGPAFDMAIAAQSRKEGVLCDSSASRGLTTRVIDGKRVICLKIDNEGRFGTITLGK